jgi:MFS family permease
VFGLGAGLFYVTYVIFGIPSNLALQRLGARHWIACLMIGWGLVSAATAFVVGPTSFHAMRLLLGAAEAGFFPGVILYLTYWFPDLYRARIIAIFMVAIPVSSFLGSPISAAILHANGWLGLHGWQWVFILEGVPAVLLGLLTPLVLTNRPADAGWLAPEQRQWLTSRLDAEKAQRKTVGKLSLGQIMTNKYVLAGALIYAGSTGTSQCLSMWQPQIIKSFGLTDMETGLLNSIPFGVASVLMILWGRRSDRTGERVWHTALPLFMVFAAFLAALATNSLTPTIFILVAVVVGIYMIKGPFWALSTNWLSAGSAAAGIAWINAVGNFSAFGGSYLLGAIKDATGSYPLGLLPLAALAAAGSVLVVVLGTGAKPPAESRG